MKTKEQEKNLFEKASEFVTRWKNSKGEEQQEAQSFVRDFFTVFGLEYQKDYTYEYKLTKYDGEVGRIDGFAPSKLIIEMKSANKTSKKVLDAAFDQAEEYLNCLPNTEIIPQHILVCNFRKFLLYDMSITSSREPIEFKLEDLPKKINQFRFLLEDSNKISPSQDLALNMKASYMMGKLYDSFDNAGYNKENLPKYLVRLLFCLFAEDTGVFEKDQFRDYIFNVDAEKIGDNLHHLFEILDTNRETREKKLGLSRELKAFRYVDGGLFKEHLEIAYFTPEMKNTLIKCCEFDWSQVKPEIFGSLFQAVMDKKERHDLGAHYTSEENILKCLKPLFLDDLRQEFNRAKDSSKTLTAFYDKLHSLKFLDPACGCGNFLIVSYRELRQLEIDVLIALRDVRQQVLDLSGICQVNVDQFYGIEIEEFPCQIAQVGMWLCDHLMNMEAAKTFGGNQVRLPLTKSANITHDNALILKWEDVCPDANFIMGNPPYLGHNSMNKNQVNEINKTCVDITGKPVKDNGKLDYVSGWFFKAGQYVNIYPTTKIAFVSTNSVTQGELVDAIWRPLLSDYHISINFAYRTFVWKNWAKGEAKVHCVIIGISRKEYANPTKYLFTSDEKMMIVNNINPYLVNTKNILVASRTKPLQKDKDIPKIVKGSAPIDDGNLLIDEEDYSAFVDAVKQENPNCLKYIRPFLGSDEYLKNKVRYCLWLKDANPNDLLSCPTIQARIEATKKFRLSSSRQATVKRAQFPTEFGEIKQPDTDYVFIPRHSSEKREYIPFDFIPADIICGDSATVLINSSLYHFGVLQSRMHMAWVRMVCGRLTMRYRYSNNIVYNNFIWGNPTEAQKFEIEKCALEILELRKKSVNSIVNPNPNGETIGNIYMKMDSYSDLRKAHQKLDAAVEKTYGRKFKDEMDICVFLLEEYQKLSGVKEL